MVETVIANPTDGEATEDQVNLQDDASKAAVKAAEDAGVVVNGETLTPSDDKTADADNKDSDSQVATRPDNVPEKFWNAEKGEVNTDALLKSQSDLEQKFLKPDDGDNKSADADQGEATPSETAIKAAEDEFAENGNLSLETYKSLDEAGFPADMVDRYIAGQQAMADAVATKAHSLTDGPEGYKAMSEWANDNLTDEEIAAFDLQVTNDSTMEYAIQQMYARYQNEADVEPDLIGGENNTIVTGDYFKNAQEMIDAINSKAYKSDPNVQLEVQKKIQNAEKQGVVLFG